MKNLFNPVAFGLKVKQKMDARNLSMRNMAYITGISHASIHRVTKGSPPTVENYFRLKYWLEQV